jgi:hypothetical protein
MTTEAFDLPPDYTDQEIVAAMRGAIIRNLVAGEEYYIRDRRVRFPGLDAITKQIAYFESRISAASGPAVNYAKVVRR